MRKILVPLILTVFSVSISFGQLAVKVKLANQLFTKYAYIDAIPFYEDLASKDGKNALYLSRLGDCYRLTGNSEKAEKVYSKLVALEHANAVNFYYYAQMLDENEKYSDAQKYYNLYKEKNGADTRSERKTSSKTTDLFKDSASYSIKNSSFNSAYADLALFPISDSSFLFASNRPNEKSVKHTYVWNNQPFLDLYTIRKTPGDSFGTPKSLPGEMNSPYHEGPIFFEKNSNTFYVTRNNINDKKIQKSSDGVNKLKIYMVNIDGTASKSFTDFEYNNNEYSVGHAAVSPDGQKLYFSSDKPGGFGLADLYVCSKENENWGKPENLGNTINTEGNEIFPFMAEDGKLYFSSEGHYGLGGLDIYFADLSKGDNIKVINPGYPLNSSKDDFSFYISEDNKHGNFSSNRNGGKGDDDIYEFTVLKKEYFLSGIARDKETGVTLTNAQISLTDETGNIIAEINTDNGGNYNFEIEAGKLYLLLGKKENYIAENLTVSLVNSSSETKINADINLEKDPGLSLYGLILDKIANTPLMNVKISIFDNLTNFDIVHLETPASGDFRMILSDKKIHDKLNYNIKIEKEGYLAKTVTFISEITKTGEIKLHEALDIALDKIEVGADIGKIIDIRPIYFDLGQWNIRKDATSELDKIVKVMNENPEMEIELGSHTDCRSTASYNLSLSDKRAKASAAYVKKNISKPERIKGKGYGESQLVNKCECESDKKVPCTDEEHQMNRRTEFKVLKM